MARGFQGAVLKVMGAKDHELTVVSVDRLAPRMRRVRFHAPTLFSEVVPEPTAWLRFWFPDPQGGKKEHQRGYTISAADMSASELDVDFVLHEPAGPASTWAAAAEPGQRLSVMFLGSTSFAYRQGSAGLLLAADASAVPAVNTILAVVPSEVEVQLYLEDHHPDDAENPLREHGGLTVHRMDRAGPGTLAEAVGSRDWTGWQVWTAGESASVKAVKGVFRGFPKGTVQTRAYWIQGRAMGTDRAEG